MRTRLHCQRGETDHTQTESSSTKERGSNNFFCGDCDYGGCIHLRSICVHLAVEKSLIASQ